MSVSKHPSHLISMSLGSFGRALIKRTPMVFRSFPNWDCLFNVWLKFRRPWRAVCCPPTYVRRAKDASARCENMSVTECDTSRWRRLFLHSLLIALTKARIRMLSVWRTTAHYRAFFLVNVQPGLPLLCSSRQLLLTSSIYIVFIPTRIASELCYYDPSS